MHEVKLFTQSLPGNQERPNDFGQIRCIFDEEADTLIETCVADHPDLQAKVSKQPADIGLNRHRFLKQEFATCQQCAPLLAGWRLDVNRPKQIDPHHLRNTASIICDRSY